LTSVQLYVDALDRYIYYFEQGVEAVTPKYVNSLVELIVGNIDNIAVGAGGGYEAGMGGGRRGGGEGLVEGVTSPEMVVKVSLILTA
jgi:vacuolar protein sorting-associated protein 35